MPKKKPARKKAETAAKSMGGMAGRGARNIMNRQSTTAARLRKAKRGG